jgi:hypothetical protein
MSRALYEPHDERMNAYYVSAFKDGMQSYYCFEAEVVFSCCAKHLREQLQRRGHDHIKIRRARAYENIFMGT